jgi:hypothetical protein
MHLPLFKLNKGKCIVIYHYLDWFHNIILGFITKNELKTCFFFKTTLGIIYLARTCTHELSKPNGTQLTDEEKKERHPPRDSWYYTNAKRRLKSKNTYGTYSRLGHSYTGHVLYHGHARSIERTCSLHTCACTLVQECVVRTSVIGRFLKL